jgi:hypothetical protein
MQIEAKRNNGHPLHDLLMIRTGQSMPACLQASAKARRERLINMFTALDVVVLEAGLRYISERADA